ncbi:MAG: hypothetical protein JXO44_13580 [Clostridia bacterium]|nr:hypothetical protein [Clostridia bacterium]
MRIEDERILTEKKAINSKILGYVYMALWLVVLHRQFILKQTLTDYLDLFLITLGVSMALVIGSVKKGLYLSYRSEKQQKINIMIGALVAAVMMFSINYCMNAEDLGDAILSTLVLVVCFLVAQFAMVHYSRKKSNEGFDEEE